MESARQAGVSALMQPLSEAQMADFDAVVPLEITDHTFIERYRAGGETTRAIIMPEVQREICNDKLAFSTHMTRIGCSDLVPRQLVRDDLTLDDFPIVLKSRSGAFGRGTMVVRTPSELEGHLASLESGEAFLQELVPGDEEFAAHLLMHEGMLVYASAVHYKMPQINLIKGYEWKPVKRDWLSWTPFKPLWHDVARSLGIQSGTLCIDYRLRDGRPVIFEINPRVGGSLTGQMSDYLKVYMSCIGQGPRIAFG